MSVNKPFRSISCFVAAVKTTDSPKARWYSGSGTTKGEFKRRVAEAEHCPPRCVVWVSRTSILHRCQP